jgi:hypothetical protein
MTRPDRVAVTVALGAIESMMIARDGPVVDCLRRSVACTCAVWRPSAIVRPTRSAVAEVLPAARPSIDSVKRWAAGAARRSSERRSAAGRAGCPAARR